MEVQLNGFCLTFATLFLKVLHWKELLACTVWEVFKWEATSLYTVYRDLKVRQTRSDSSTGPLNAADLALQAVLLRSGWGDPLERLTGVSEQPYCVSALLDSSSLFVLDHPLHRPIQDMCHMPMCASCRESSKRQTFAYRSRMHHVRCYYSNMSMHYYQYHW